MEVGKLEEVTAPGAAPRKTAVPGTARPRRPRILCRAGLASVVPVGRPSPGPCSVKCYFEGWAFEVVPVDEPVTSGETEARGRERGRG